MHNYFEKGGDREAPPFVVLETTTMNQQIQQLRVDLSARFPERRDVVDGALAPVLAGEHVLLLGPPGTAKSALARAIADSALRRERSRPASKVRGSSRRITIMRPGASCARFRGASRDVSRVGHEWNVILCLV